MKIRETQGNPEGAHECEPLGLTSEQTRSGVGRNGEMDGTIVLCL